MLVSLVRTLGLVAVCLVATMAHALAQDDSRRWRAFDIDSLIASREVSGQRYLGFLDRSSMSAGLYSLTVGSTDRQRPHERDEVYYVTRGRARLEIGDESIDVRAGSIAFVQALVPHRFTNIAEDLEVVVVFVNGEPGGTPAWSGAQFEDLAASRSAAENVWNVFFDLPTLVFGLYMMPEALGGDRTLTHPFDELNLVVGGSSMFRVGKDSIAVRPGSIMFVEAGVGHSFDSLEGDLDVLILWERKAER